MIVLYVAHDLTIHTHPLLLSQSPFTIVRTESERNEGKSVTLYSSVSQPPGRGPVPGPGINYTGPREVLLEFVILVF